MGLCTVLHGIPNTEHVMARPSDLWFRKSTGHWYTTLDGVQVKLDPSKTKARSKLQQLLRGGPTPAGKAMSFTRLADKFLSQSQAENDPETYEVHKLFLQSFIDHVGHKTVPNLCEDDLDSWCRSKPTWGDNTRVR